MIAPDRPLKPRNLTTEVVEVLTRDILDERIGSGDKLPTEAAIMRQFGVSRTVVREAISRLQAAGLVQTRHGIGTFVLARESHPPFRIDPAQLGTLRDVIALLELRISIEVEAAALAAQRREPEQLAALLAALREFEQALEQGTPAVAADQAFHAEIARATQNPYYAHLMQSLGDSAIPRSRIDTTPEDPMLRAAYLRRVHQEHESIYNAIQMQDAEAARAAMRTHLSNSRDRLRRGETAHA